MWKVATTVPAETWFEGVNHCRTFRLIAHAGCMRTARKDAGAPRRALRWSAPASNFRKQDRQGNFRREHAARVVPAQWDDGDFVLGFVFRVHITPESLTTSEARRSLGHRRTR